MQSPRFSSSTFSGTSARSASFDRFPNAPRFAPIFAGRELPPAPSDGTTNPNAAFFSEFAPSFAKAARRLTAPTAEVRFDRFGFATLDDFSRRFAEVADAASLALLFADDRGFRFLLVAPPSTLRLLFAATLGFDVAELCANEALWSDFNADVQTPPTSFEQETFAQEAARFAALSPFPSLVSPSADVWRLVSFPSSPFRAAHELDDVLFYWERRFICLAKRVFPWTLVFSTRRLLPLVDAALPRQTPETSLAARRPTQAPNASFPSGAPSDVLVPSNSAESLNSSPNNDVELAVVVERGEMSADAWRRLKPGDVLTTNVPANALFLGLVDGAPRFLCRPGLFRGAAAIRIQSRADDARE